MKGILLKELYLLKKHCAIPLFCLLLFLVMAGMSMGEQSMMVFFPFMYASIIPVTLLSYDEMHKWDEYARIFPYTLPSWCFPNIWWAAFCSLPSPSSF